MCDVQKLSEEKGIQEGRDGSAMSGGKGVR